MRRRRQGSVRQANLHAERVPGKEVVPAYRGGFSTASQGFLRLPSVGMWNGCTFGAFGADGAGGVNRGAW